jgi:hypothetical protein
VQAGHAATGPMNLPPTTGWFLELVNDRMGAKVRSHLFTVDVGKSGPRCDNLTRGSPLRDSEKAVDSICVLAASYLARWQTTLSESLKPPLKGITHVN